jgi:hypothetical protein
MRYLIFPTNGPQHATVVKELTEQHWERIENTSFSAFMLDEDVLGCRIDFFDSSLEMWRKVYEDNYGESYWYFSFSRGNPDLHESYSDKIGGFSCEGGPIVYHDIELIESLCTVPFKFVEGSYTWDEE